MKKGQRLFQNQSNQTVGSSLRLKKKFELTDYLR